ncbi:hypothetical protein [Listeria booriae]|uniref:Uncharacterized protein n=1 Tax=Listeria booriae TaxID=1552123 RepID=A0A7X1CC95_9LIST|nr:hypothetical protein [Listeria booriae]MBC1492199.1 hypothetical protein [Listeria booriae]MBC1503310.1 hypothetical protein [Listeria booriae]
MCIFNKERFQETLWLEGVGIIPEEAIQERLQLLIAKGWTKAIANAFLKRSYQIYSLSERASMEHGKWSSFQMETSIVHSIPCYFNIKNYTASQLWKKTKCIAKFKRNTEKR